MGQRNIYENYDAHMQIDNDEFFENNPLWDQFVQEHSSFDSSTMTEQQTLAGESSSISQSDQEDPDVVTDETSNIEPPAADDLSSEEESRILNIIFNDVEPPTASYIPTLVVNEIPIVSDVVSTTPVKISDALTQLSEKKRYVIVIKANLDKYDEIIRLQSTFLSERGPWYKFSHEYSMACVGNNKDKTCRATFIPVINVCNAFSLAQHITSTRYSKPENIFFYEVSTNEVVTSIDDGFFKNHTEYSYASIKQGLKGEDYVELKIKFDKFDFDEKVAFINSLRSFLDKFSDLRLITPNSKDKDLAILEGNGAPYSLNSFYSLNIINDEIIRLARHYSLEISITMHRQSSLEANSNVEPPRKKQRTAATVPLGTILNSFFQKNTKISPSLVDQIQKTLSKQNR